METNQLQVVQALNLSVTAINNQQIGQATRILFDESYKQGYIIKLVNIINDAQMNLNIIYAALAQLKNILKQRWRLPVEHEFSFEDQDRNYLVNRLIQMNIRHAESDDTIFRFIKTINGFVTESIIRLMPRVFDMLEEERFLKACLNILLGMSDHYRFENNFKNKSIFIELLKTAIPLILMLVRRGQHKLVNLYWSWHESQSMEALKLYNKQKSAFEEILYMSIKFASKTIMNQLPIQLRRIYSQWFLIVQSRLEEENQHYNSNSRTNPYFCGKRGTDQFNYFHAKKWSAKFMIKFFQRMLIYRKDKPQIAQITAQFYKEHGESFRSTIRQMLANDRPNTVRYFELYVLQRVFQQKPKLMSPDLDYYLFELLPSYFRVTPKDLENLEQNPLELFMSESNYDKNLKPFVRSVWIDLALKGSSNDVCLLPGKAYEGEQIIKCFRKLGEWLLDQSWQIKQIAIYLMIHLGNKVRQFETVKNIAMELLNLCLPHIFDQPLLILQVRGFELIQAYSSWIDKPVFRVLQQIIVNVFRRRQQTKQLDLLSIKAGIALKYVLQHGSQTIRSFNEEQIRLILSTFLELIKIYEIEELSHALVILIDEYPSEMRDYSRELVLYISRIFKELIEKELQTPAFQNINTLNGIFQILKIMIDLINRDKIIDFQLKDTLEEEVGSLLNLALINEESLASEFIDNLLLLLASLIDVQTNVIPTLPDHISFYNLVVIFKLLPLNTLIIENIQRSSRFSPEQKLILEQMSKESCIQTQTMFDILRNYLKFINPQSITLLSKRQQISASMLDLDFLNQFFYVVFSYYKTLKQPMNPKVFYELCRGRYLVTSILICLIEQHQKSLPPAFYTKVIRIIDINSQSVKIRNHLKSSNMELFAMWLWSYQGSIDYLMSMKKGDDYLKFITSIFILRNNNQINKVVKNVSRKRIMLGMIKLIEYSFIYTHIECLYPYLLTWIFYYVNISCLNTEEDEEDEETKNIGDPHILLPPNDEDENAHDTEESEVPQQSMDRGQDFFTKNDMLDFELDEQEGNYYHNKCSINELEYFLETLVKFQQYNPLYYQQYILNSHYYELRKIYMFANLAHVQKFRGLINEEDLNHANDI